MAQQRIGAFASGQAVIASAAIKRVIAIAAAIKRVIAKAARKEIGKAIAQDAVIKITAQHVFNAGQAVNAIRAGTTARAKINRDRARGAGIAGQICAIAAHQAVIAIATAQRVIAISAADRVIAIFANQAVIAGAAQQAVIIIAAS